MKKGMYLISIFFLLLNLMACGDDGDSNNSNPTAIDFTSESPYEDLDSYLYVSGTDSDFRIMVGTKLEVTSSELLINNEVIDLDSNWENISLFSDYFTYGVFIDDSMLPSNVDIAPGNELTVRLKINETTYSQVMTIADKPVLPEQSLDLEEDFSMSWTLANDSDVQLVSLSGESYFWDNEDEGFELEEQLNGDKRNYTFSKNNYSQYVITGLSWYEYGVEAINYHNFGSTVFVLSSDNYQEDFAFKSKKKDAANRISLIEKINRMK